MTEALEPALTHYDMRVLGCLAEGDETLRGADWRSAWNVAEQLEEDDVADVRRILNALVHLGYATATKRNKRRVFVATPWRRRMMGR